MKFKALVQTVLEYSHLDCIGTIICFYFFPVRNPEKSRAPSSFFTIRTAHPDRSRQHYNYEPILLPN